MSIFRKHDNRLFDADERSLVEQTRQSAIREVSEKDLAKLIQLLRERRKRARDVAKRQAREMRGKAEASGKGPARQNLGTQWKAEALAGALSEPTMNESGAQRLQRLRAKQILRVAPCDYARRRKRQPAAAILRSTIARLAKECGGSKTNGSKTFPPDGNWARVAIRQERSGEA